MDFQKHKFFLFFIDFFPTIILQNSLIANILNIVGIKFVIYKDKIDNTLNTDI